MAHGGGVGSTMGMLRSALFDALCGLGNACERAAKGWHYLAAGALRVEDLRRATLRQWQDFGEGNADYFGPSGFMRWEEKLYFRFLKPEDRILLVGCGTGRDLLPLLEQGYRAEGLDLVPQAIASARRLVEARGLATDLYVGPIETVALPGQFDAFIFSWFCYSYIPQSRTRIAVLRKARAHLNPGGRIMISYLASATPLRRLPIRLTRLVAWVSRSDWSPEYGDTLRMAGRGMEGVYYEHHFGPGEFEAEAQAAGLRIAFRAGQEDARVVLIP